MATSIYQLYATFGVITGKSEDIVQRQNMLKSVPQSRL
jgi:hypothetical protein